MESDPDERLMYDQAFHTCCRNGLTTPTLAFQFQTASPGLSGESLSAAARAMVGYVPPPAAPPAPSVSELAQFPRSLRYLDVAGVGPCVCQTVYVGREDRAGGGEGQGRFGNYFSHVVAAVDQPTFDTRRHPIEMWESPVWRTDAAAERAVSLATLPSGPVSLARAIGALGDPARKAWLPFVFDSLDAALSGRARIVILDHSTHGWAWIAAVALLLPLELSQALTFDTYTGEPDRSAARLLVSDPSVERTPLSRKVLTGELAVVDLQESAPAPSGLLGRAVAERTVAVTAIVALSEEIGSDLCELDEVAVVLAAHGESPLRLLESDLPLVLGVFTRWLCRRDQSAERLQSIAALLDAALDESRDFGAVASEVITAVFDAATRCPDIDPSASQVVLRIALRHPELVSSHGLVLRDAGEASSAAVGDAIALISDSEASVDAVLTNLLALESLGLIGINGALDRRAGRAVGRLIDHPEVADWLDRATRLANARAVAEHAIKAAAAAESVDDELLRRLGRPPLREVLASLAAADETFTLLQARALTAADPAGRAEYLTEALCRARSDTEAASIARALYGRKIESLQGVSEVLDAFVRSSRRPTSGMIEFVWDQLRQLDPFAMVRDRCILGLVKNLKSVAPGVELQSIEAALWLAQERNGGLKAWYKDICNYKASLNSAHTEDILRGLARGLADTRSHTSDEHNVIVANGISTFGGRFILAYKTEVGAALAQSRDPELALRLFVAWGRRLTPDWAYVKIVKEFLPEALRDWRQADRDQITALVERTLPPGWQELWLDWCEQFPPHGAIGRTVGRLMRRRPE